MATRLMSGKERNNTDPKRREKPISRHPEGSGTSNGQEEAGQPSETKKNVYVQGISTQGTDDKPKKKTRRSRVEKPSDIPPTGVVTTRKVSVIILAFLLIGSLLGFFVYSYYRKQKDESLRNNYYWSGTGKVIKSEYFDDGEPEYIEIVDYENATIEIYEFIYDKDSLDYIDYVKSTEYSTVHSVGRPIYNGNGVEYIFCADGQLEHWVQAEYNADNQLTQYRSWSLDADYFVVADEYRMTYSEGLISQEEHNVYRYTASIVDGLSVGESVTNDIEPEEMLHEILNFNYQDDRLVSTIVEDKKKDSKSEEKYQLQYDKYGGLNVLVYSNTSGNDGYAISFTYSHGNIKDVSKKYNNSTIHSDNSFSIQYSSRHNRIARLQKSGNKGTDTFIVDDQYANADKKGIPCIIYDRRASVKNNTYINTLAVRTNPKKVGNVEIYLHSVNYNGTVIDFSTVSVLDDK